MAVVMRSGLVYVLVPIVSHVTLAVLPADVKATSRALVLHP